MYRLSKVCLTLSLMFVLAQTVSAQPPQGRPGRGGPGGRGGFGPAGLLQNEGVQKELKLTDDQIKKVQDVAKDIREKHKDDFDKVRSLDQAERREKMQELTKTVSEETTKALADVLKPEQQKRLKQLTLQREGTRAFSNAEVQMALKLTDEQKDKIKTISSDSEKEMRELFQNAGGDRQEAGKKMQALHKETQDKVMSVLTEDQKKSWKDLTGEPFEFQSRRRPRTGT